MPELAMSRAFDCLRPTGTGDGVAAIERLGLGMATVIARRGKTLELVQRVRRGFGVELVEAPLRYRFERASFVGIGHGKWLAVFEAATVHFIESLQLELGGLASIIDQSHAYAILRLSGPALLATLEKGVQIDLSAASFPVGRAAATNIAHIGVNLWKVDDAPTLDIAVPRSLVESFSHWLETSAAIYGLAVHRRPL